MASISAVDNCMCWMFCAMGIGGILCERGSDLGSQLSPFLSLACIELCGHIFTYGGACVAHGGSHMDRLLLDHFQ